MVVLGVAAVLAGCSGKKPVPFGLEDADPSSSEPGLAGAGGASPSPPAGEVFDAGQVEVQVGDLAMVMPAGYALSALRTDLDGDSDLDALVVSADANQVRLHAGVQYGMGVRPESIAAFVVPEDCVEPKAAISYLSKELALVEVEHACREGRRRNIWIVSLEAQPRARERITVLPPNQGSQGFVDLTVRNEDRDSDGYEDVIAEVTVGETEVPLAWLNRPGGFARDSSEPQATLEKLADNALGQLESGVNTAGAEAQRAIEAYTALCRESGAARVGLSGTHGLQCGSLPAVSKAASIATASAIARGDFLEALRLTEWWDEASSKPSTADRARVDTAWKKAKSSAKSFRPIAQEAAEVSLRFEGEESLLVGGKSRSPRRIAIADGTATYLRSATGAAIRSPNGRFEVRGVKHTCRGFEAEIGVVEAKRTFRVLIDAASAPKRCESWLERSASALEWQVLGWAPQGLVLATNDRVRVVPLRANARPAGSPFDLPPGASLPAPLHGPSVTPDGSRYLIPQSNGILLRSLSDGDRTVWLRPSGWGPSTGKVRAVAISPSGQQIAVHKGNEIGLLRW